MDRHPNPMHSVEGPNVFDTFPYAMPTRKDTTLTDEATTDTSAVVPRPRSCTSMAMLVWNPNRNIMEENRANR